MKVVVLGGFNNINSDWSRDVHAPPPYPANHRSGHSLIGSRSHARIRVRVRVSCHDAAQRASHSPAAQLPPAVQAAVATLKCMHLITVEQCDTTASVVPLTEIQNIKRTALCPTVTRYMHD